MSDDLIPVKCPRCEESQNTMPAGFDPKLEPFGPVHCMVCGHEFARDEYLRGLELRRRELAMWLPPPQSAR